MAKSHLKLRYARFFFKITQTQFLTYAPAVADE
jgi:hypothetical protein